MAYKIWQRPSYKKDKTSKDKPPIFKPKESSELFLQEETHAGFASTFSHKAALPFKMYGIIHVQT